MGADKPTLEELELRAPDRLDAAGLVPISLVRWELTGDGDRVPGVGFAQPRNNR